MWITDIEGNLINLLNASKVIAKDVTTQGIDPTPIWWCAVTFNGTPKPAILYSGSEENAKRARDYLASKLDPIQMIEFEDDDPEQAAALRARAAQYQSTDSLRDRLREVGRS